MHCRMMMFLPLLFEEYETLLPYPPHRMHNSPLIRNSLNNNHIIPRIIRRIMEKTLKLPP